MEKQTIFITGGTGYIGLELIKALSEFPHYRLILLVRDPANLSFLQKDNIEIVTGDLLSPDTYAKYLQDVDTVIHLAALTGKASKNSYFNINSEGTQTLINASKTAGIKQFLHMSTIAVTYQDQYRYYYAQSKALAEKIVSESGLNFCILRPTIIIDQQSKTFQLLKSLAQLKVIPFPVRTEVKIQPVSLDDVIKTILKILEQRQIKDEIIDLGGPDRIYIIDFFNAIHISKTGQFPFVLFLPHQFIKKMVGLMENLAYKYLPVSAGQMAPFGNDSIANQSKLLSSLNLEMLNMSEMLSEALELPSSGIESILKTECRIFTKYLVEMAPDDYIIEKYQLANKFRVAVDADRYNTFDMKLLQFARFHPFTTKLANTYCIFFSRDSLLLRKLTLLLSILEYAPTTHQYFDENIKRSVINIVFSMIMRGIGIILALPLSILLLGPFQIFDRKSNSRLSEDTINGKS